MSLKVDFNESEICWHKLGLWIGLEMSLFLLYDISSAKYGHLKFDLLPLYFETQIGY